MRPNCVRDLTQVVGQAEQQVQVVPIVGVEAAHARVQAHPLEHAAKTQLLEPELEIDAKAQREPRRDVGVPVDARGVLQVGLAPHAEAREHERVEHAVEQVGEPQLEVQRAGTEQVLLAHHVITRKTPQVSAQAQNEPQREALGKLVQTHVVIVEPTFDPVQTRNDTVGVTVGGVDHPIAVQVHAVETSLEHAHPAGTLMIQRVKTIVLVPIQLRLLPIPLVLHAHAGVVADHDVPLTTRGVGAPLNAGHGLRRPTQALALRVHR